MRFLHGLDTFWARGLSWIDKERERDTHTMKAQSSVQIRWSRKLKKWNICPEFYKEFATNSSYPLHRYEFCEPKFFSKTCKFSIILYPTWQISGGGRWRKACRSREKKSKQSEVTWKQSEPVRSISKIEKRREFVRALWYEQCPKNSFKRLYNLKGLLVLVGKASFSKEFRSEFHSGGGGYVRTRWTMNFFQESRCFYYSSFWYKIRIIRKLCW